MALISWFIWKARNEAIFRRGGASPLETIARANFALTEFSCTRESLNVHMDNPPHRDDISHWKAPDRCKYKANCDAAISTKEQEGVVAVVLHDWEGKIVDGRTKTVKVSSS